MLANIFKVLLVAFFSITNGCSQTETKSLDEPIADVNANSIAIMPYAFCTPENPVIKFPVIKFNNHGQWWGENDEGVIGSIKMAHAKKWSVMLKPHLWIAHGIYTGEFKLDTEKDWQLWEDSYRDYILHFATIADRQKVELLCIGTELGTAIKERPQYWQVLIDTIRQVYGGKLTYAGNWDDYKNFPFWHQLDYIGVDAYFPLVSNRTPSVSSLNNAWEKHISELEKISTKNNVPILFTEYGYRNVDHNAKEPWKENEGRQNDEAQANSYEALYQSFAGKDWFAGGYLWKWYVDKGHHGRREIDFTPQGKTAEKVIAKWYAK